MQPHVHDEEMFLANYGDGLSDVPLPAMVSTFEQAKRSLPCCWCNQPASFDIVHASPGE